MRVSFPLSVVEALLDDKAIEENKWAVDGESECLIPADAAAGPFRIALRSSAGVDRLSPSSVEAHATACLEFSRHAGLWTIVQFASDEAAAEWEQPVRSALLLLADSGFGGERSRGWGRANTRVVALGLARAEFARRTAGARLLALIALHAGRESFSGLDPRKLRHAIALRTDRERRRLGRSQSRHRDDSRGFGVAGLGGTARRCSRRRAGGLRAPGLSLRFCARRAHSVAGGRMKYRLTCLTPTLVGDGQKLAPIDYMVWKDNVNVLDQRRIFRLLAKGPRLEGYLSQLKKAEKLDFASWGGFAQNYSGRRIPFEHPSSTQYWERTHAEHLFIPTFATGPAGPYLPATASKARCAPAPCMDVSPSAC